MLGRRAVTVCFFGDGAVAEGYFHESLNLAALWRLPVLFACENNLYAMGTALRYSHAQPDLAEKARSYALPAQTVDGMDVHAVERAAALAVAEVREGRGPVFLELKTYRFRAHSMFDVELYRDKSEVEAWKQRDPIPGLAARMLASGKGTDADLARLEVDVAAEIDAAVAFAEAGTSEPVEELTRYVYAERGDDVRGR
jgi:TPP-dependent pyruvate/acetoin dehydrogenase alpha subunit